MRRTVTSPVLVLIGASYRTAPLPRREALALDSGAARQRAHVVALALDGVDRVGRIRRALQPEELAHDLQAPVRAAFAHRAQPQRRLVQQAVHRQP